MVSDVAGPAQDVTISIATSRRADKDNNIFFFNCLTSINFKIRHCLILLLFVIFLHSIPLVKIYFGGIIASYGKYPLVVKVHERGLLDHSSSGEGQKRGSPHQ